MKTYATLTMIIRKNSLFSLLFFLRSTKWENDLYSKIWKKIQSLRRKFSILLFRWVAIFIGNNFCKNQCTGFYKSTITSKDLQLNWQSDKGNNRNTSIWFNSFDGLLQLINRNIFINTLCHIKFVALQRYTTWKSIEFEMWFVQRKVYRLPLATLLIT